MCVKSHPTCDIELRQRRVLDLPDGLHEHIDDKLRSSITTALGRIYIADYGQMNCLKLMCATKPPYLA